MSGKYWKVGVVLPLVTVMASMNNNAAGVELAPNPNPAGNTITIDTPDVESHGDPYENFGTIDIISGGVLTNFLEFTILRGIVSIEPGGKLVNDAEEGVFVVDEIGSLSNFGIVDNYGRLKNSWAFDNQLGSVFNNYASASLTNTNGMDQRGELTNAGSFLNSVDVFSGDGAYLQNVGEWTNSTGSAFTNLGVVENFGTIANSGFLQNRLGASGGITQGKFSNRHTVDNLAEGVISNEHRWFNRSGSVINNRGTFTNSTGSLGLSNESESTINNLAGGTFHANQVVNNSGQISNAGTFEISMSGSIGNTGGGTYSQTNGSTIVRGQLSASVVDIQGGALLGGGTLNGPVTIGAAASLDPGNSLGIMTIVGKLDQLGTLNMELRGAIPGTEHDQLDVTGTVTLAGKLNMVSVGPYADPTQPGDVDAFAIISAGDVAGTFDEITYDGTLLDETFATATTVRSYQGNGLFRLLAYGSEDVTFANYRALPGDADGDSVVDGSDFNIWNANKFADGTDWTTGDFNGDGMTDGSDFNLWNSHKFTSATGVRAVPEPTWSVWLALAVFGFCRRLDLKGMLRLEY